MKGQFVQWLDSVGRLPALIGSIFTISLAIASSSVTALVQVSASLASAQPSTEAIAENLVSEASPQQEKAIHESVQRSSTVWASQSLARLMQQHKCAASTPPSTQPTIPSKPGQSVLDRSDSEEDSRYKIAALLFSCLEHWDKVPFNGQERFNSQEKRVLKTLRSEFKFELVALSANSASEPSLTFASIPQRSVRFDPVFSGQTPAAGKSISSQLGISSVSGMTPIGGASISKRSQNPQVMGLDFTNPMMPQLTQNTLGINAKADLGKIQLFGRYGVAQDSTSSRWGELLNTQALQAWTAGVGIENIVIPNSLLTVAASRVTGGSLQPTQTNYGAFYQFPITEQLTLSPRIVIMTHPDASGQTSEVQGALQATFSF
ncbi:MAG: carbohydrate porin [Thermosynechococcaceae cyanobacterium MS004]|nr:carbohydrate porin [Thermosynechococcaceae cyanobacterium MS004]